MYQLFAPQDGDYSYHGLNFAAYGGKVNRFDGYGDSHLNAVRSSNPRRDGYYIADGAGTRREITYEQALELAKNNPNIVVNYYKDNVGGTGRLHWDKNQNQFIDNNEYFGKELDNVDVVKFVDQPARQLTDAIPISTPVLEYRPDITPYVDFTNTDQNMFHRRNVANADAAVREALSSNVVDHAYDYMMPSAWAGAADKLFDHDEDGNLKYNFFTDFNKVFNPAYDNQGWVGLVGADQWAKEHPEEAFAINFGTDLVLPFGIKGIRRVGTAARNAATWEPVTKLNSSAKAIPNYKLAGVKLPLSVNKMVDSLHNLRSELNEYLAADNNVYRELIFMEHHPKLTRFINELSLGDNAAGLYGPGKNSKEFLDFFRNKIQEANPEVEIPEFSDLKSLADWEESMALSKDPIKYTGEYGAYRLFKEQH